MRTPLERYKKQAELFFNVLTVFLLIIIVLIAMIDSSQEQIKLVVLAFIFMSGMLFSTWLFYKQRIADELNYIKESRIRYYEKKYGK